jgi:hypothetical protein
MTLGNFCKRLFDEIEILGPTAKMQGDECRVGMLGEHAIALRHQLLQGWELRAVEAPIGMLDQFFVAFVAASMG